MHWFSRFSVSSVATQLLLLAVLFCGYCSVQGQTTGTATIAPTPTTYFSEPTSDTYTSPPPSSATSSSSDSMNTLTSSWDSNSYTSSETSSLHLLSSSESPDMMTTPAMSDSMVVSLSSSSVMPSSTMPISMSSFSTSSNTTSSTSTVAGFGISSDFSPALTEASTSTQDFYSQSSSAWSPESSSTMALPSSQTIQASSTISGAFATETVTTTTTAAIAPTSATAIPPPASAPTTTTKPTTTTTTTTTTTKGSGSKAEGVSKPSGTGKATPQEPHSDDLSTGSKITLGILVTACIAGVVAALVVVYRRYNFTHRSLKSFLTNGVRYKTYNNATYKDDEVLGDPTVTSNLT